MSNPRLALVFPGQGSQAIGMLAGLPEHDSLDRLLDAAEALSGLPLRKIAEEGPADHLSDTRAAQPLLYLADWVWGATLLSSGVEPDVLAGHSLGELAALALADVFSVEAGLELVVERSKLMSATASAAPGGMSAVLGLPMAELAAVVETIDGLWVANDNSPGQVVISGSLASLGTAEQPLLEAGARRVVALAVAGPFHSPMMEPARSAFEDLLSRTEFRAASIPVAQNVDPSPTREPELIKQRLAAQITAPVRWTETIAGLSAHGPLTVIECGPGGVLKGLARRVDNVTAFAVESDGLESIVEEVI